MTSTAQTSATLINTLRSLGADVRLSGGGGTLYVTIPTGGHGNWNPLFAETVRTVRAAGGVDEGIYWLVPAA